MIGEPSIDISTDAAPAPQDARAADRRHQRHAALADILDRGQIAALRVAVVAVDIAAEHQAALVGLADVEMTGAERDDAGDRGFNPSDTKACSTWISIGSRRPAMAATREVLPADGDARPFRSDRAARGLDAGDAAARRSRCR